MEDDKGLSLSGRVHRAQELKAFMDNPVIVECFKEVERQINEGIATTDKQENALALWHRVRGLRSVKGALMAIVADGVEAAKDIQRRDHIEEHGPPGTPRKITARKDDPRKG